VNFHGELLSERRAWEAGANVLHQCRTSLDDGQAGINKTKDKNTCQATVTVKYIKAHHKLSANLVLRCKLCVEVLHISVTCATTRFSLGTTSN
jgi:hypothetical protein